MVKICLILILKEKNDKVLIFKILFISLTLK